MLIDDVERTIRQKPGLTATQIAAELFGLDGYGERVRAMCQALHASGRIERDGDGRPGSPFKFYPGESEVRTAPKSKGRRGSGGGGHDLKY